MIVIANTEPIALSIVEGCAQSPRSNVLAGKGLSAKRKGFSLLALSALLLALWVARLASELFEQPATRVFQRPVGRGGYYELLSSQPSTLRS